MVNAMEAEERMDFDVVIVGAGPAGLSAAIRIKQLCQQNKTNLSVCVLEKSAEVGGHILSGAVFDTRALDELIPDWASRGAPLTRTVTTDHFSLLTSKHRVPLPTPPQMKNTGNFIISLGLLCRWLAEQAQALGVDIFPGFAANGLLIDQYKICGVRTGDGMALYAKHTLIAEGARGSLARQLIADYSLAGSQPQTYALGIKEIWQVDTKLYQPGKVEHTVGWPLSHNTYGGSFIYHLDNNQISLGMVVGLDYSNPTLSPFEELQRFKTHPKIKPLFEGGQRISYGARALTEGGWQSIPHLNFPGGYLIGCAAGFVDVPQIKGNHTAMKSGMIAAECVVESILNNTSVDFDAALKDSWVGKLLYKSRNIRPGFHQRLIPGLLNAGLETYLTRGHSPWTLKHRLDNACLKKRGEFKPIVYPKPDNILTFDRLSSLPLTGVYHNEDQPCHLVLTDPKAAIDINLKYYDSPEQYYCPAQVYEIIGTQTPRLQINAANCIHCKACDIKDPTQNITWQPPEGGGGPNYGEM
jgi:electron-transferring-flavoprotein dehydrogenase